MKPALRRSLIIGGIVVVVLGALYFGISSYIGYQETAGQNAALQTTPVSGVTLVHASNFAFGPANIQVRVGTTVTWKNTDAAAHTVTFDNGMADSGAFAAGQTYSYTFTHTGTFSYHCAFHPQMVGRVTVTP